MEYRPGDEIREFVKRTRDNLEAIRDLKKGVSKTEVWEFTQLINSMLGLLVFPRERYVDNIPKIPLSVLRDRGWRIPKVVEGFSDPGDLSVLFRLLRNSVAHCNIEFLTDSDRQLNGLRVYNKDNSGKKTWLAEISKEDLEDLTNRFVSLLLDSPPDNGD